MSCKEKHETAVQKLLKPTTHSKADPEKCMKVMIINFLKVLPSATEEKETTRVFSKKTVEFCIGRFLGPQY